jgi:NAD(P)-dependent dehydrogenase (short-subunit alcohol dehydrogenase family)
MRDLAGKTAFITGAASGIGLGTATSLSRSGVKVMLCDIERRGLDRAVADLRAAGGEVDAVVADVSLKSDLEAAAKAVLDRFGEVHIVHNNAGIIDEGGYGAWTDAGWAWAIGVNLMGVVWGVEIFAPLIERHGQGGHIVNTASIAGLVSGRGGAYRATKYGVVALSEGLRVELAPRGIGVSALCPGFVRTQISDSFRHVPDRFAGDFDGQGGPAQPGVSAGQGNPLERVAVGLDPLYVGDLVREGIQENWAYIFTDTEFEGDVAARFDGIKSGFDAIRGRVPPH